MRVRACFLAAIGVFAALATVRAVEPDRRLTDAVTAGNAATVRTLLRQRLDVTGTLPDGNTLLHVAAERGHGEVVDLLLGAGAPVDAVNRYGLTPLFVAASRPTGDVPSRLLRAGAAHTFRAVGGETPLMAAARLGNVDAARALLEAGADINAVEATRDQTALMWAAGYGHPAVVKLLLERGANTSLHDRVVIPAGRGGRGGGGGGAAAGRAAGAGAARAGGAPAAGAPPAGAPPAAAPPAAAAPAGAPAGAAPAAAGRAAGAAAAPPAAGGGGRGGAPVPTGGMTALSYAARQGNIEAVRLLLDARADINEVDAAGWTSLLLAISNTHYDTAMLLLERGADVNKAEPGGRTPLYTAVDMHTIKPASAKPIRPEFASVTSVQLAERLLARGANPNVRLTAGGATPLLRAAADTDLQMLRLLLANGADAKAVTDNGNTALMQLAGMAGGGGLGVLAAKIPWDTTTTTVQLLLDAGVDINAQNMAGDTVLHGVARRGDDTLVKLFVEKNARMDVRNERRLIALEAAEGKDTAQRRPGPDGQATAPGFPKTAALIRELMTARQVPLPQ